MGQDMLWVAPWPSPSEEFLARDQVTVVFQVDGKVRDKAEVVPDTVKAELEAMALASERVQAAIAGRAVARVVVVPGRLVNVVTTQA